MQIIGIDILSNCKGKKQQKNISLKVIYFFCQIFFKLFGVADPERQFNMVFHHVMNLRLTEGHSHSRVHLYVERNLGFEAEHHKRALSTMIPNCEFYMDQEHDRVGVLTTNEIKHGMAQLTVLMLEESRIHIRKPHIVSRDPAGNIKKLREQMEVYSYQYKTAQTVFQKGQIALSGKVGGMKDDICICLQLACYFTQIEKQREQIGKRTRVI